MATIVERDSGTSAVLIFILFALLVVGGIWFAYANGIFNEKTSVIKNNKTIILPTPSQTPQPSQPVPLDKPVNNH
jgi:hypothetical protein